MLLSCAPGVPPGVELSVASFEVVGRTALAMISSGVLVQMKGSQRSFQPSMNPFDRLDQLGDGAVPLPRNEVRHLFVHLGERIQRSDRLLLHWSIWRRHHQAVARAGHYRGAQTG
jgi:hypothetical protein